MKMEHYFNIEIKDAESPYQDIVFNTGSGSVIISTDSYYYYQCIDKDKDMDLQIKNIIIQILDRWKSLVESGLSFYKYLPLEFYDQCIGCFRVSEEPDNILKFEYGFTDKYDGWSLPPCDVSNFLIDDTNFNLIKKVKPFQMKRQDFLSSTDNIKSSFWNK